jgi:Flp pilus assembly protein TadG
LADGFGGIKAGGSSDERRLESRRSHEWPPYEELLLRPFSTDEPIVSESGSVTAEFAFVVLPLFAILFMTVDLGWIIFGSACIQEGAREGVRYAVTGSGQSESSLDSSIKVVVQQYSFGIAKASNISVDYYPPTGYSSAGVPATLDGTAQATAAGNIVKVTVQGVSMRSFGPLFRTAGLFQLSGRASDVLQ